MVIRQLVTVHSTISEDSSGSDETESRSESDLSTSEDEHEDTTEEGIPVSPTQGDGVDFLWDTIQEKVL